MIKIGILGELWSGKSFVAKQFGYPVFNADNEVRKIYRKDKKCFIKLNKAIPKHILSFPIKKKEIAKAILSNKKNLKKIINIVHPLVRLKMNKFVKKKKNRKIIIFDIPLLLENKLNRKDYILVYVEANKIKIIKNLIKRKNYNSKIMKILKKSQLSLNYKKKKSKFIINNNFTKQSAKKNVSLIKKKILKK